MLENTSLKTKLEVWEKFGAMADCEKLLSVAFLLQKWLAFDGRKIVASSPTEHVKS